MTSVGLDRGLGTMISKGNRDWEQLDKAYLANWPAMRAIRMTGLLAPE